MKPLTNCAAVIRTAKSKRIGCAVAGNAENRFQLVTSVSTFVRNARFRLDVCPRYSSRLTSTLPPCDPECHWTLASLNGRVARMSQRTAVRNGDVGMPRFPVSWVMRVQVGSVNAGILSQTRNKTSYCVTPLSQTTRLNLRQPSSKPVHASRAVLSWKGVRVPGHTYRFDRREA